MLLLQFKILPGLHSVGHTSSSRLSSRRHRTWCWTWWRRPSWRRSCWRTGQGWPTPSWTLFCRFTQWHLMYLALCRSSNVVRLKIFAPSWCRWNSLSSAGLALARGPGGKWLMGCLSYLFLSQISLIFICNCFLFGQKHLLLLQLLEKKTPASESLFTSWEQMELIVKCWYEDIWYVH